MKVHAATGRSQPFVDAKALAKGLSRLSSLDASTVQSIAAQNVVRHGPRQAGLPVRARTGPLLRHVRRLHGGPPDQQSRPRAVAPVQPRRQVGRVRPRFRPVRGRHRHARPSAGSPPAGATTCATGMPTGSITRRSSTAAGRRSGGAPTRSGSRSWSSTMPASLFTPSSTTRPRRGGSSKPTTRARASRTRRSASAWSPAPAAPVQWADLADYSADSFLISEVGWWPDSSAAYCYVQDRIQTWLDFVKFTPGEEQGLGEAAVPRSDQGLDREPGARALARRRHVPLALASATAGSTSTSTTPAAT